VDGGPEYSEHLADRAVNLIERDVPLFLHLESAERALLIQTHFFAIPIRLRQFAFFLGAFCQAIIGHAVGQFRLLESRAFTTLFGEPGKERSRIHPTAAKCWAPFRLRLL